MKEIDKKILRLLLTDGGMTNSLLAKQIGLSESATLERVRRLETEGVIEGKSIKVHPKQVGRGLEFLMTFNLKNQGLHEVKKFEKTMLHADEVLSCSQLLGRFDFIAHVAVKDMDAMKKFIDEKLIPLGVIGQMESLTILNMLKRNHPPFPLEGESTGEEK